MNNEKSYQLLEKEYIKKYKKLYWVLHIIGFSRYSINKNKVVELTSNTLVYRLILLLLGDLGVGYLLYVSVVTKNYLKVPDGMVIIHFASFGNMLIGNLLFLNRNSGLIIISKSFKIDIHLGIEETKFMRDVEVKIFTCLFLMVAFTNISGGVFLYRAYDVSMAIHFIGSGYFFWLFFGYVDYFFLLLNIAFISIRARYLNVALAKIGGMKVNYLSDRALLNIFFWKQSYNELVTFQCRASPDDYRVAFEMLFKMLRLLEKIYKFPVFLAFWTIVMGTFVTSQTFIERIKNPNALEQERTYIIIGWALLSWGFMTLMSLFVDLFNQQIEQTRLICACIQLKPNMPTHIYKLSKTLLRVLERRTPHFMVCNLFVLDTGLILRMAAATFVYITVQLQLAFPNLPNPKTNVTTVDL